MSLRNYPKYMKKTSKITQVPKALSQDDEPVISRTNEGIEAWDQREKKEEEAMKLFFFLQRRRFQLKKRILFFFFCFLPLLRPWTERRRERKLSGSSDTRQGETEEREICIGRRERGKRRK